MAGRLPRYDFACPVHRSRAEGGHGLGGRPGGRLDRFAVAGLRGRPRPPSAEPSAAAQGASVLRGSGQLLAERGVSPGVGVRSVRLRQSSARRGSPKLLSLWVAEKIGAQVVATDIEAYFIEEYELLRQVRHVPPERLRLAVEDGRRLSFEDDTFDRVYSLSVLEHIPYEGDSECVRELARVLAPRMPVCHHRAVLADEPRRLARARLLLGGRIGRRRCR